MYVTKYKICVVLQQLDASKRTPDDKLAKELQDNQAIYTCEYIIALAKVFIQAAPFLREKYPQHPLVARHALFHSDIFNKLWVPLVFYNVVQMEDLTSNVREVLGPSTSMTLCLDYLKSRCEINGDGANQCLHDIVEIAKKGLWGIDGSKAVGGLAYYTDHLAEAGNYIWANSRMTPGVESHNILGHEVCFEYPKDFKYNLF